MPINYEVRNDAEEEQPSVLREIINFVGCKARGQKVAKKSRPESISTGPGTSKVCLADFQKMTIDNKLEVIFKEVCFLNK